MTDNELIDAVNKSLGGKEFAMARQAGFWESIAWLVLNIEYYQDPENLRKYLQMRANDE
jgi:hypothetical protein